MMTPQLQKIAIKKRASHPSSNRDSDLDFRKLLDKVEQAEITLKLEETENLNLQYVNNIQPTTSQIINIHDSDTDLSLKIFEVLNMYERNSSFKDKSSFKNGVFIAVDTDKALPNVDKNNKIIKIDHKNTENQTLLHNFKINYSPKIWSTIAQFAHGEFFELLIWSFNFHW